MLQKRPIIEGETDMQPASIRKFSLFYLAAFVVILVATLVNFEALVTEAEAQGGGQMALGVAITSIVAWAGIILLLWYLIARKGYAIAKWLFVAYFLFSVVTSFGIFAGGLSLAEAAALAALVLQAAAMYYLFQPDAKAWFAHETTADASLPE